MDVVKRGAMVEAPGQEPGRPLGLLLLMLLACMLLRVLHPAHAQEVRCTHPSPRSSQEFRDFLTFVGREYAHGRPLSHLGIEGQAAALGHALGRAAQAVRGDPRRHHAFACIELALEQHFVRNAFYVDIDIYRQAPGAQASTSDKPTKRLYRLLQEAARGMHDDLVRRSSGVTATSPAFAVFAGVSAAGSPSAGVTQRPVSFPRSTLPIGRSAVASSRPPICPARFEYWSVTRAADLAGEAAVRARNLISCEGNEGYRRCRQIVDLMQESLVNLTQVFTRVRPPGRHCWKCVMRDVPSPAAIGRTLDATRDELWRKGMRTSIGGGWGYHYASFEAEPLCDRRYPEGSFAISPVPTRTACEKHCQDAPKCRFAYYNANTRTCSWVDDAGPPRTPLAAGVSVYDRARRQWAGASANPSVKVPAGVPAAASRYVLKRVIFAKQQLQQDLCRGRNDCVRFKGSASGIRNEQLYRVSRSAAEYHLRETVERTGAITTDYKVNFSFVGPPQTIRAGDQLRLQVRGNQGGKSAGGYREISFVWYLRNQGGSNRYSNKSPSDYLKFINRYLPRGNGGFAGSQSGQVATTIVVPKAAKGEFVIGGRFGWEPALFVEWVYEVQSVGAAP